MGELGTPGFTTVVDAIDQTMFTMSAQKNFMTAIAEVHHRRARKTGATSNPKNNTSEVLSVYPKNRRPAVSCAWDWYIWKTKASGLRVSHEIANIGHRCP